MHNQEQKNSSTELLKTNGFNNERLNKRIDEIRALLEQEKLVLSSEEVQKLERILRKSLYKDYEMSDVDKHITESSLRSEKYFNRQEIESFVDFFRSHFSTKEIPSPKLTRPKTKLRLTQNSQKKENIENLTTIQKIENGYKLKYEFYEGENIEDIEFDVIFRDNKTDIIFKKTYVFYENSEESNRKIFPEEIQIAMLKKLIKTDPEVLKKIKESKKINCTQDMIHNLQTISNCISYLSILLENDHMDKRYLASNPNSNNTNNFMHQLKHEFEIEIERSSETKLSASKLHPELLPSIKQTFFQK